MTLHRVSATTSVIDILDRVLDKGIVIDAWVRVAPAGIDLITVEARIVVASITTNMTYAGTVDALPSRARPLAAAGRPRTVQDQLHRVGQQLERRWFAPAEHRRAEDCLRDALHDARARTIAKQ